MAKDLLLQKDLTVLVSIWIDCFLFFSYSPLTLDLYTISCSSKYCNNSVYSMCFGYILCGVPLRIIAQSVSFLTSCRH